MFIFFEKAQPFDVDTRPQEPIPAAPANRIQPIRRRRKYSHKFSAGRNLKLVRGANGQNRWRLVPDASIVFYGKQDSKNTKKRISKKDPDA